MLTPSHPIARTSAFAGCDTSPTAQRRILLYTLPLQKPLGVHSSSPPQPRNSAPLCHLGVLHSVRTPAVGQHLHRALAWLLVFLSLHGASCPLRPSSARGPSFPPERNVAAFSTGPVTAFSTGAATSAPPVSSTLVNSTHRQTSIPK
jgi:hypothetical protein